MKKITLLVLLTVSMICPGVQAREVDKNQAQLVARNFYYERINHFQSVTYQEISVAEVATEKLGGTTVYYGISMLPGGFVLVSADDAVIPVLGYSFTGNYPGGEKPANFGAWMDQHARTIEHCRKNQTRGADKVLAEWERLSATDPASLQVFKNQKSVEPLLTSKWDQGKFYNTDCPNDQQGPDGHALTGCVATAMGQILYYYRWPEEGTGSYNYTHPVYGNVGANFGNTTYDWDNMQNQLASYNAGVSELLFHMGASVDMNYGPFGSGMWNHKAAYSLGTYFKCLPSTQYVWRDSTQLDWDSLVIVHLDRGQVMYYAGWSDYQYISGHAFVCDGYQDTAYCHFNWGWSGAYDGYFYLNALNPGGSNFNLVQELIINIHPDTLQYSYPNYCQGSQTLHYYQGTIEDGSGPIQQYQDNTSCEWLIAPQVNPEDSVSSISLSFQRFDTEAGQDILSIYDGPTDAFPLIGNFSGNAMPPAFTSSSNQVLIRFTTDSQNRDKGWLLSYRANEPKYCTSATLTSPVGTVSDGSGLKHYTNNTLCNWTLQPANAAQLELNFLEFDTENIVDFLEVYDLNTQVLLGKFSGNQLPPSITAPSGAMYLIFKSNGKTTAQGWKANYSVTNLGLLQQSNETTVQVFPNPSDDIFVIGLNNFKPGYYPFTIKNLLGQEVLAGTFQLALPAERKSLDLSSLKPGTYLIQVRTENGIASEKLLLK